MVKKRRGERAGIKLAMLLAAMAIGLSGCGSSSDGVDPIAWYRDLSGNSSADTKDKAANSQNLAQGGKQPYPNLASVPKQPDNAITKADRDRLAKGLIADRQNAQYTDEQLHAGQDLHAIPPPPPEPNVAATPPKLGPKVAQAAPPSPVAAPAPAPKLAAAPRPGPVKQEALAPPRAAGPVPASATAQAPPSPPVAQAPPPPAPKIAQAPPPPAPKAEGTIKTADTRTAAKKKDDAKKKKEAKVKRGSEPPPAESPLRAPKLGAMPTGEQVRAPPPQPPGTPNAPSRAERRNHTEEVAAASPPPRSDVDGKRGRSVATEIRFAPGPFRARLTSQDKSHLAEIAKMVAHNNGRVRIVGYGVATEGGDAAQREFQSFDAALDNAKAVGIELAKLGVPASRIDIETARGASSSDRAEVFVEY